jgi:hypothetical protein
VSFVIGLASAGCQAATLVLTLIVVAPFSKDGGGRDVDLRLLTVATRSTLQQSRAGRGRSLDPAGAYQDLDLRPTRRRSLTIAMPPRLLHERQLALRLIRS